MIAWQWSQDFLGGEEKGRQEKPEVRRHTGNESTMEVKEKGGYRSHNKGKVVGCGDWLWRRNSSVQATTELFTLSDWENYGNLGKIGSSEG